MKIGFARYALDWAVGLPLAGYSKRKQPAVGYHRPLYVRAAVFLSDDEAARFCLISAEILCVDVALTERLRLEINRVTGIAPDAIMVTATHTHASAGGLARFPIEGGAVSFLGAYADEQVEQLVTVALRAVQAALSAQVPARLGFGRTETRGIAANRRERDGIVDPYLNFLIARNLAGEVQGGIFSYSCHSTVLDADNLLYSGDLIGTIAALLEARWGTVLGLAGAAGNVSTRFTRRASTPAEVERLAELVADAVLATDVQPIADEALAYAVRSIIIPLKQSKDTHVLQQTLERAQARLQNDLPHAEQRIVETEIEGLQLNLGMRELPPYLTTEIQALRVGGAYLLAFPGELFVEYGIELTERLAPTPVLIAGYADDYIGYVPMPTSDDGYEGDSAIVAPGVGSTLVQSALDLVGTLREGKR